MTRQRTACLAVIGATVFAGLTFAAPATAQDLAPESEGYVAAIEAAAPGALGVADIPATRMDGFVDSPVYAEPEVDLPTSVDVAATLTSPERTVQIALPFSEQASDAVITEGGVTTFDNNNESATVPVVHEDGSLQIFTVIDGPEAPTHYDYEIKATEGSALTLVDNGGVVITDAAGNFEGAVTPPWAKDASGASLPTHYEVAGMTITQVVEHSSAASYPVVADPWLGIQLFGPITRGSWRNDYTYNGAVTAAGSVVLSGGGGVGGYLAGGAVFRANGWDEWKARWPAVTNKATLKQQFDCHVAAGSAGLFFTGPYNLERAQSNRSDWAAGVVSHRCNWDK